MTLLFELLKIVFGYAAFVATVVGALTGITNLTGDLDALKLWGAANKALVYVLLALGFIVYAMARALLRFEELRTEQLVEEAERQIERKDPQ